MASNIVGDPDAPLTISRVADGIKNRIDAIPQLWITGEILKVNTAGAQTFLTLADPGAGKTRPASLTARMDTVAFRRLAMVPKQGDQIIARAVLSFWATSSQVAAALYDVRLAGDGAVLERIEELRRKLRAEGLFDPGRKKIPPRLPNVIGLITGQGSHAESDVLTRTKERWPDAAFRVVNTPVQGADCAPAVIAALGELDNDPAVDVIVIARGGGSITDLVPFSDERLIRAVAAAFTPVVSAIGHEPDRPILDDVADIRVGTPTHAAAAIVPDVAAVRAELTQARTRMLRALNSRVASAKASLAAAVSRPVLTDPGTIVTRSQRELTDALDRLRIRTRAQVTTSQASLAAATATMVALSPAGTLARGYAVVRRGDGSPLGPLADLGAGTALDIRVVDGHLAADVTFTSPRNNEENR